MIKRVIKYLLLTAFLLSLLQMVFAAPAPANSAGRTLLDSVISVFDSLGTQNVSKDRASERRSRRRARASAGNAAPDSIPQRPDSLNIDTVDLDSLAADTLIDTLAWDTPVTAAEPVKSFLDEPIHSTNTDSLVYDVVNNIVHLYNEGNVDYQNFNMKADYMRIDINTKDIYAHGKLDTAGKVTRPQFTQGSSSYTMDTITYNMDSEKAKIKNVATQEGEGFLIGRNVKRMPDQSINISKGMYTTCDNTDHPHFGLAISRAKLIPGKKVIVGPSYLVMEDVPIYFLGLPEGFFPLSSGRHSGFLMPSYGEESIKGFFLRDGGYYFAFNDYVDMTITGGIYTLGSWSAALGSNYVKKYKYRGSFQAQFSKDIVGDKGSADYVNQNNLRIAWTHTQDPKFKPNSTFSASVNYSTSGYSKYGSTTLNDYLNTQTNSSIAYSKSWPGTPFSFSTNIQHSQNSRDSTISISLPNVVFNMSKVFPFKRRNADGKQRWYEKISISYTGNLSNTMSGKQNDLFSKDMFKKMRNGVQHNIPISTSLNLFNYINISPSANYTERWYFSKINRKWDPETNRAIPTDTTFGFYRIYNYSASVNASTKLYARWDFKNPKFPIRAIRYIMTPTVGASYTPDFSKQKYGYYEALQTDSTGTITYYSPFSNGMYGVPGSGKNASMNFSLDNSLEMKVNSKTDTTGMKKIKLIESFRLSGSYNFLADSMKLSTITLSLRTTIKGNFGINLSAVLDPYEVDPTTGRRYNKLTWRRGNLGRIASTTYSFGYTFNSRKNNSQPAVNDINSHAEVPPEYTNFFYNQDMDPVTRRTLMTSAYYDFDLPWNFGFNYSVSYTNNGVTKNISQTLGFNGSITPTPKWGITFNAGYDFRMKTLTPGTVTITRDLHCWQMSFNWVPIGYRKSWSFNIGVKASTLQDLKYDKTNSHYDNLYD